MRNLSSATGGGFEILLLEETSPNHWWAMLRPGRRAPIGARIQILDHQRQATPISALVEQVAEDGTRRLLFTGVENISSEFSKIGETPLPPYIRRSNANPSDAADIERYQTVYARTAGSVAACRRCASWPAIISVLPMRDRSAHSSRTTANL